MDGGSHKPAVRPGWLMLGCRDGSSMSPSPWPGAHGPGGRGFRILAMVCVAVVAVLPFTLLVETVLGIG
jgi:hypothetical protein